MYCNPITSMKNRIADLKDDCISNELISKLSTLDESYQVLQSLYFILAMQFHEEETKSSVYYVINMYTKMKIKYIQKKYNDYTTIYDIMHDNPSMLCPFAFDNKLDVRGNQCSYEISQCILCTSAPSVCQYTISCLEHLLRVYSPDCKISINHHIEDSSCYITIMSEKYGNITII